MNNYFVYLPKQCSIWGCVTTAAGYTNILPGTPYPPPKHPLDHHFDCNKGRVLQSYQIILISAGTGMFESAAFPGIQSVEPGATPRSRLTAMCGQP